MAEFGGERTFAAQLVFYSTAVAGAFVEDFEGIGIRVDAVGSAEFPFVLGALDIAV